MLFATDTPPSRVEFLVIQGPLMGAKVVSRGPSNSLYRVLDGDMAGRLVRIPSEHIRPIVETSEQ